MNNDSLLTTPLSQDANQIIGAINLRSREIQQLLKNISIPKKITQTIAKILAVTAGIIAIVSIPIAIYQMSFKPLAYGCAAVVAGVMSGILLLFLDRRSPSEAIIKDEWQLLFSAMNEGDGVSIVERCKCLMKKRQENATAFANAIGHISMDSVEPFLQKTLFTGNLLNALKSLDNDHLEEAKSYAHLALSSFVLSGLPKEAADCAHAIVNKPGRVINRLNQTGCPKTISDLDAFVTMMTGLLDDEHLHDFVRH